MLKRILDIIKGVWFEIGMIIVMTILIIIQGILIVFIFSIPGAFNIITGIGVSLMLGISLYMLGIGIFELKRQLKNTSNQRWNELERIYKDALQKLEEL